MIAFPDTYLSEYARSIHSFLHRNQVTENDHRKTIVLRSFEGKYFNSEELSRLLEMDVVDFLILSERTNSLFEEIYSIWKNQSFEQFSLAYRDSLVWTGNVETCLACFTWLKEGSVHLSMLKLTGLTERSLGSIYNTRRQPVPNMLKDILFSGELELLIGDGLCRLLRLLLGPPESLNVRNLFWHGFIKPGDTDARLGYCLLAILATIGTLEIASKIELRAKVNFEEKLQFQYDFKLIDSFQQSAISKLISLHPFIDPQLKPLWQQSLECLFNENYESSICLLFPILENCLRIVFCFLNSSMNRIYTVEKSEYFTTFDEILSLERTNKLVPFLGAGIMAALHDLLILPEGPRVRDRVSHGENDAAAVDQLLANHIWSVVVAVLLRVTSLANSDLQSMPLKVILDKAELYSSHFHPFALLCQQVIQLEDSWKIMANKLSSHPRDACAEHPLVLAFNQETQSLKKQEAHLGSGDCAVLMDAIRPQLPIEADFIHFNLIKLLHLIGTKLQMAVSALVSSYETKMTLLNQQRLRQRQRDNFNQFIEFVPLWIGGTEWCLHLFIAFVVYLRRDLQSDNLKTEKFLKRFLKWSENVVSSIEENKWTNCQEIYIQLKKETDQLNWLNSFISLNEMILKMNNIFITEQ